MLMTENIEIKGARQHNLKNIDVAIPINTFTVITGLSGSGKSSLAFDTLYAEGQRRYVESLSAYARQFLGVMTKPDVDSIKGLSPAIAIQQKKASNNPRSTVGTVTEIYDYLRLLFAHVGTPHCPNCGQLIKSQDAASVAKQILSEFSGARVQILAPLVRGKKGTYEYLFVDLKKQGFSRVRVDGVTYNLGTESILLKRYVAHTIELVIDRFEKLSSDQKSRVQEATEQALKQGSGFALAIVDHKEDAHNVNSKKKKEKMFSRHLACVSCGISFPEMTPRMFSFNAPQGACEMCHGIGSIQEFDEDRIMPDKKRSIAGGGVAPWRHAVAWVRKSTLDALAEHYGFSLQTPLDQLPKDVIRVLLDGDTDAGYEGIIPQLKRFFTKTESEDRRADMHTYLSTTLCTSCHGKRLRKESLSVKIQDKHIIDVTNFSIEEAVSFFENVSLTETQKSIAKHILKEIRERLNFLLNVGLNYLSLSRTAGTLSGGEAQRIHLATQIGSDLRGVLYILDEPSIGLHQRDNKKLIDALCRLRDIGNTVIVVEHDEETMRGADHVIDIGPGAGIHGGEVVAEGTVKDIEKSKKSLTGDYLSGRKSIPVPSRRRPARGVLTVQGARQNNLKNIDVSFPLGVFCCVTGVSGGGKSSLVIETLYPVLARHTLGTSHMEAGLHDHVDGLSYIDKAIIIDQDPIGRTPRSNPVTYTGIFTDIRDLFSATKEAKMRGYLPGRFSFNVKEGRCGACEGDGIIKIEMHFLPNVYVTCEICKGKRYDEETLTIRYKEKNIADILAMTVEEARHFFASIPRIKDKLQTLFDVGLGYLTLGQSAPTLSGGEAQRIKLSTELSRRDTGRTVYILDEPTTGLHFEDIKKLLEVLNRLVEKGNSVIVIEHNLDVIKTADHIIDLGPEGGDKGGELIASGTPEQVAKVSASYTGQFLKKILK